MYLKNKKTAHTQNPKRLSFAFKLYLCRVFTRELVEMLPPPLKRVIHPPEHPSQQEPHQLCHQDLYFPKEKIYKLLKLQLNQKPNCYTKPVKVTVKSQSIMQLLQNPFCLLYYLQKPTQQTFCCIHTINQKLFKPELQKWPVTELKIVGSEELTQFQYQSCLSFGL